MNTNACLCLSCCRIHRVDGSNGGAESIRLLQLPGVHASAVSFEITAQNLNEKMRLINENKEWMEDVIAKIKLKE